MSGSWTPLGPVPLASDASGVGLQDYHQVSGRATAVAIDPADTTGNTVYIGGAQGGIWKSTNAANPTAASVTWTPVADDAVTLSVGSIAIQPGNTNPTNSLILVGTGEANSSQDSYFGLGILRSTDAGNTWALISSANGGALSFSGLGGTRMAFSTANTSTVVSTMGTSNEGMIDGAITANTMRGLYTSQDSGQTWTYDALLDPGNQPTDATSATSIAYNAMAGIFLAAVRYHGFYSSPDGVTWTRLATQPGNGALSTTACPSISTSNNRTCPIYRAEITVVPGRNEMYVWIVSLNAGTPVDGGVWQSLNGGNSWTEISDNGITNCGDSDGCGVQQGFYNLELQAIPNGSAATDLYAGAINLYKCSISSLDPTCSITGFLNLTHTYGCDPIAAPSHVHPDQHALDFVIPTGGSDAGGALIYFANDGGIYRALNGFTGLTSGSCSAANQFDDLNQNLGSMTQFVTFSQHPSDPNTLLGGTQDNGSPATSTATTSLGWGNVNGGDGGYNAIDPNSTSSWYVSNPDVPPGGLNIEECSNGINCVEQNFASNVVVGSNDLGGDDGAFYFPYLLDPQSSTALVVGTCRVWRGPRAGGIYTVLSPNFDTLGSGTCSGSEVNLVRALSVGGPTDGNGSEVIYATTDGPGPLGTTSPAGGNVWVTTNASAGTTAFTNVTQSINPNQFPISAVAIDPSDPTGKTAYVTIMGFTGSNGHVWQTTNAGVNWADFSGSGSGALFSGSNDAPVNAVVVDGSSHTVYVGTDIGVFASPTSAPNWTEVGPSANAGQSGFLPNVAVTALGIFSSGSQKLLRVSTYGRGIWQFNLNPIPNFQLSISNPSLQVQQGQTAVFNGTITPLNGYNSSITLSCIDGTTTPPSTCNPNPPVIQPGTTTFTINASGMPGSYNFTIQGVGSDPNQTMQKQTVTLDVSPADFDLNAPATPFPTVKSNNSVSSANGQFTISGVNGFTGNVNLSCSLNTQTGTCNVAPQSVTVGAQTASYIVTITATSLAATNATTGPYQFTVTGTFGSTMNMMTVPFNVSDYILSGTPPLQIASGLQGTANLTITPSAFYTGTINVTCDVSALTLGTCTPPNQTVQTTGNQMPLNFIIGVGSTPPPGPYNVNINTSDTMGGEPSHSATIAVSIPVQNFSVASSPSAQTLSAGQSTQYTLTLASSPAGSLFSNPVILSCPQGLPSGAQCTFSPSATVSLPNGSTTVLMTISTSANTPAGNSSITVTGTSGSVTNSATVSLTVTAAPPVDFTLAATPVSSTSFAGTPATISLKLQSTTSANIQVTLSCNDSSLLGAQACSLNPPSPIAVGPDATVPITATINVPSTPATITYPIIFTATDPSGSQTTTFQLTVAPDFVVSNATPTQTITAGQTTGAYQLTVAPNPPGSIFPGAVTLTCSSGLPSGAQCLFNPSAPVTLSPGGANVTLSISTSGPAAQLRFDKQMYFYAFGVMLPGIAFASGARRHNSGHSRHIVCFAILFVLTIVSNSCGSGQNGGSTSTQTTGPGTYFITVTGTSSGAPSSSPANPVTLIVE